MREKNREYFIMNATDKNLKKNPLPSSKKKFVMSGDLSFPTSTVLEMGYHSTLNKNVKMTPPTLYKKDN